MLTNNDLPNRAPEHMPEVLSDLRTQLRRLFAESMNRIDVTNVMTHAISTMGGALQIGKYSYPLRDCKKVVLIAVGKAAIPMCRVAVTALQSVLDENQTLTGIAVGPGDRGDLPDFISSFAGGHPFPNEASCEAAEAALKLLESLSKDDLVLYLISGGASSMMEAPISPSVSCAQLQEFYRTLVYSGLPITSMNALRKHFSKIKGGRLALAASPARQCSLIISDVPENALDMVGSGPSLPDQSTIADCRKILSQSSIRSQLSEEVLAFFENPELAETPSPSDVAFSRSDYICLLSNQSLLEHVQSLAKQSGYHTEIDTSCDDWHYQDAATHLLSRMRSLRKLHKRVCLISGGELSVKVSDGGGLGGRNQHFALHCALNLEESDPTIAFLSAGTDGVDGNSPAAGAIADSLTAKRLMQQGVDPFLYLRKFDSYTLFNSLGDTIVTGPTGNNVRDLRAFLSS